jgi:hypothetical protein
MFVSLGGGAFRAQMRVVGNTVMAGSAISRVKQRGFRIDIPIVLFILPSYVDLFFLLLCGGGVDRLGGVGVGGL